MENITDFIDVEDGLRRVRGSKALYAKMLSMFMAGKEISYLEESLAANDIASAADIAHALKGAAANLSLIAFSKACTALMESLQAGSLDENIIARYRDILEQTLIQVEDTRRQLEA